LEAVGDDIDGESENDGSGYSVSLSYDGSIVAIGARYNNDNGNNYGHVRVYRNENDSWNKIGHDIEEFSAGAINGADLGYPVSLSSDGSIVAIGSSFSNENGNDSGHVRVYTFNK